MTSGWSWEWTSASPCDVIPAGSVCRLKNAAVRDDANRPMSRAPVLAVFENWECQGRISIGAPFGTNFQISSISSSVTAMQP